MLGQLGGLGAAPLKSPIVQIALAAALGMFLGLEREWSQKTAGIRTFALVSLLGALFTILGEQTQFGTTLVMLGGGLVLLQGAVLAAQGLLEDEEGLALTTSMSMLVAYGVGILVASGKDLVLVGVTVAVLSSLLLVLKRELHTIAWGLSREELRSVTEFAILAFVVYPLLPSEPVSIGQIGASIEPRIVWAMVVFVAGIGIVNYVIVMNYGGRGIAVTGFFGGLASSTAVVGTMIDHVRQDPEATSYALAGILLSNSAMALRNLVITVAFTFSSGVLFRAVTPLAALAIGGVAVAAFVADWGEEIQMDLESPFSMRNALAFGAVFLLVVVANAVGKAQFGQAGILTTAAVSGLVSSAGGTTAAVALYRTGDLSGDVAVLAILLATASSIAVKSGLTTLGREKRLSRRVAVWSASLIVGAGAVAGVASLAGA